MGANFPKTDTGLLAWANNLSVYITGSPAEYGLTLPQADTFNGLVTTYTTALAACEGGQRSTSAVSTKNDARAALKSNARLLANIIESVPTVTDAQKLDLGLTVRSAPKPQPAPTTAPGLDVVSVAAWTVKIRVHSGATSRRGKPPGVIGASVFSYIGATPSTDIGQWKFEGMVGKSMIDVNFANTSPGGTVVWLTAFWFNNRKETGPASTPVSTTLQGGSVSMAA